MLIININVPIEQPSSRSKRSCVGQTAASQHILRMVISKQTLLVNLYIHELPTTTVRKFIYADDITLAIRAEDIKKKKAEKILESTSRY